MKILKEISWSYPTSPNAWFPQSSNRSQRIQTARRVEVMFKS